MTAITSKKAIAAAIFIEMSADKKPRKEIIFSMIERAGLTNAGAATYYNNFKTSQWSTAPTTTSKVTAAVTVPEQKVSGSELSALWNAGMVAAQRDSNEREEVAVDQASNEAEQTVVQTEEVAVDQATEQ